MGLTAEAVQERVDSTVGLFAATIAGLGGRRRCSRSRSRPSRAGCAETARRIPRTVGPVMATAVCVYAPVVGALAFAYDEISPWSAFLFLAPALAAQQLFSLYQEKARLYEEQLSLV